jgi:hypothetical protein
MFFSMKLNGRATKTTPIDDATAIAVMDLHIALCICIVVERNMA